MAKWYLLCGAVACLGMAFLVSAGMETPWWVECILWGFNAVWLISAAHPSWMKEDKKVRGGWRAVKRSLPFD